MVVETFLVVSAAAFDLAVMPRGSRADRFVCNAEIVEKCIKTMHTLCLLCVAEFASIIRLYRFRSIAEVSNSSLQKSTEEKPLCSL